MAFDERKNEMNHQAINVTTQTYIPDELIDRMVDKVIERLKPLLSASNKIEDSTIFNVEGLAEYLKVEKSWIYKRTRTQEIPFIKKDKYCLFRKSAIDAWLNQDAIKPLLPYKMPKKQP